VTKYNLPYGSTVQGMEILHKGNHFKGRDNHPDLLNIYGMYKTPTAASADINNWSKIATITGTNIIYMTAFSGVSQGTTTFGAYRLTIKVDPNNESKNIYNKEIMATNKVGFKVVKKLKTSDNSITYEVYAQILNTADVVYFSPVYIQNEGNVTFYKEQPYVALPSTDGTYTVTQIDLSLLNPPPNQSVGINPRLATDLITAFPINYVDYYDIGSANVAGFPAGAPGTLVTYRGSNDLYSYQIYYMRQGWGTSVYKRQWNTTNTNWDSWTRTNQNQSLTTSQRNSLSTVGLTVGDFVFDTTLNKPIWCKTTSPLVWVDSTGTTV
jgi:hypothetical protein